MAIHEQTASFDVVVVGGGFSGVCAAIAAAREGAKVALVQNRPVFGGSGSSETRMHIVGANCHSSKPNLRETGILEEILLENKRRNPYADFPVFDTIVWEKVRMEPNITILLNTNIDDVVLDGDPHPRRHRLPEYHRDAMDGLRQDLHRRHRPRHGRRDGRGGEPHRF